MFLPAWNTLVVDKFRESSVGQYDVILMDIRMSLQKMYSGLLTVA